MGMRGINFFFFFFPKSETRGGARRGRGRKREFRVSTRSERFVKRRLMLYNYLALTVRRFNALIRDNTDINIRYSESDMLIVFIKKKYVSR